MKTFVFAAISAATVFIGASVASAATFTYDINNVVFDNGAVLSGTFAYDETAMDFTDVEVTLSGATPSLYDATYDDAHFAFGTTGAVIIFKSTGAVQGDPAAGLRTNGDVLSTLGGGTADLDFIGYGRLTDGTSNATIATTTTDGFQQSISGATISGAAVVPLPATLPLLALALGGVGIARRTRKAA